MYRVLNVKKSNEIGSRCLTLINKRSGTFYCDKEHLRLQDCKSTITYSKTLACLAIRSIHTFAARFSGIWGWCRFRFHLLTRPTHCLLVNCPGGPPGDESMYCTYLSTVMYKATWAELQAREQARMHGSREGARQGGREVTESHHRFLFSLVSRRSGGLGLLQ